MKSPALAAVLAVFLALPAAGSEGSLTQAAKGPDPSSPAPFRKVIPETLEDWGELTRRPDAQGLSMDIPWQNPEFRKFREAFLSPGGRKWLEAVMARSAPYAEYVAERLRLYRLPQELFFLPVIESEWSPRAVSRSGAMGLWQFMRNSVDGYDMRINEWVDERRDFMKSTDAACRKLRDNYETLGSWEMALAAYNAGLGAVSRAAARAGTRDFWELSDKGFLPPQTASYVPKFLAVVSLLSRGARNGLPLTPEAANRWDRVELERPVDLTLLSEASGVPLEALRTGNPELRYDITPPDGAYTLKVPAGSEEAVRFALSREDFKPLRYYLYTVRSGDTLSALSRHYEVSVSLIEKFNPGVQSRNLRIGSALVIPALKDKKPYIPEPSPGETLEFTGTYHVARGDTLWSISLKYGIQPETLAEKNGLEISSIIREGMALNVPKME